MVLCTFFASISKIWTPTEKKPFPVISVKKVQMVRNLTAFFYNDLFHNFGLIVWKQNYCSGHRKILDIYEKVFFLDKYLCCIDYSRKDFDTDLPWFTRFFCLSTQQPKFKAIKCVYFCAHGSHENQEKSWRLWFLLRNFYSGQDLVKLNLGLAFISHSYLRFCLQRF